LRAFESLCLPHSVHSRSQYRWREAGISPFTSPDANCSLTDALLHAPSTGSAEIARELAAARIGNGFRLQQRRINAPVQDLAADDLFGESGDAEEALVHPVAVGVVHPRHELAAHAPDLRMKVCRS
jgi:hypothetical protein